MLTSSEDYKKSRKNLINNYNISKDDIQNILQKVSPVEQSRIDFLTSRSWWSKIYTYFQEFMINLFPGTHVVGVPDNDSIVSICKLDTIHIPNESTIIIKMEDSRCHDNCVDLYLSDNTNKIFTGYALSKDGLWRHHSWVINKDDHIVETTELRLIYVGYDSTSTNIN